MNIKRPDFWKPLRTYSLKDRFSQCKHSRIKDSEVHFQCWQHRELCGSFPLFLWLSMPVLSSVTLSNSPFLTCTPSALNPPSSQCWELCGEGGREGGMIANHAISGLSWQCKTKRKVSKSKSVRQRWYLPLLPSPNSHRLHLCVFQFVL